MTGPQSPQYSGEGRSEDCTCPDTCPVHLQLVLLSGYLETKRQGYDVIITGLEQAVGMVVGQMKGARVGSLPFLAAELDMYMWLYLRSGNCVILL